MKRCEFFRPGWPDHQCQRHAGHDGDCLVWTAEGTKFFVGMSDEEHGVGWPEDEGPVSELRRLRAAVAMSRAEADDLRSARDRWMAEHDEVQDNLDIVREANAEMGAGLERFHNMLAAIETAYQTFVDAHGPLVDYSTSAEMVDLDLALAAVAVLTGRDDVR